jgi:predicted small lipoprotein YifL
MRDLFGKLLSTCLAALVLLAFSGCGEDKGPVRTVDDKDVKTDEGKPGGGR